MNSQQRFKLEKIPNLNFVEYFFEDKDITGYEKIRCPICLKYKCIFCNKCSTLKNFNCCPIQLIQACYKTKINDEYHFLCYFKFFSYTPLIREWYIGFMINFLFFRGLTQEKYLLLNKDEIMRKNRIKINDGYDYCLYQTIVVRKKNISRAYNIIKSSGVTFWTIVYFIFFEEILLILIIICSLIGIKYYKNFLKIFYLLAIIPGLRGGRGYIKER